MKRTDIDLAYDIIDSIEQTNAWFEAYRADPAIKKDFEHFKSLIKQLPADTAMCIEEAYCRLESDVTTVAILYGMRAMLAIHEAMEDAAVISQYKLDRIGDRI